MDGGEAAMTKTRELLEERQTTHGEYTVNAQISQDIMTICHDAPSWPKLTRVQRETLHMIAHKMARILGGNPNVEDHWRDIAGYAVLAADRVTKKEFDYVKAVGEWPTQYDESFRKTVPVEDSNKHADQMKKNITHDELMNLPKEEQMMYRWAPYANSYKLDLG
jgi:hypothetical protein